MEMHQLRYFQIIAKTQNYHQAADLLNVSQPALTKAIHKLEAELGVTLFDRIGRNIRINQNGELFLKRVTSSLQELKLGINELHQLQNPKHGIIRIAFIQTLGTSIVPILLSAFRKSYPNVKIKLFQDTIQGCLNRIDNEDVDLSIIGVYGPIIGKQWLTLESERLYGYCSAIHPLQQTHHINLCELQEEAFIGYAPNLSMHDIFINWCKEAGFIPQIAFEGSDVPTIAGLVSANLGIAIMPTYIGIEAANLHRFVIEDPICSREIVIAWHDVKPSSPSTTLFIEFVKKFYKLK